MLAFSALLLFRKRDTQARTRIGVDEAQDLSTIARVEQYLYPLMTSAQPCKICSKLGLANLAGMQHKIPGRAVPNNGTGQEHVHVYARTSIGSIPLHERF